MAVTVDPAALDPEHDEAVVINALAMRGFPPPMPGCELRPCLACARDTWAAPSSLDLETRGLRTSYLCRTCALKIAQHLGGLPVRRLATAEADVTAPGSLVTPEGEEAMAERLRSGQ